MWFTADEDAEGTGADIFYVVSTWEEDWQHEGVVCHYADVWNGEHRAHMAKEISRVAAYVMGYKLTPADTLCAHIRPAKGETDTGVAICYNTVKDVQYVQPVIAASCCAINPVNWHTDATPAILHDTITVTVDTAAHVLVVSGYSGSEYAPYQDFINVGDIHSCEPWLYSACIRQNIEKRIARFKGSK